MNNEMSLMEIYCIFCMILIPIFWVAEEAAYKRFIKKQNIKR
jgi:hypothetical protein